MKLEEIRKMFDSKSFDLKEIKEKLKSYEETMREVDLNEHDIFINKQAYVIVLADIHLISPITAKELLDLNNEEYKEKHTNHQEALTNLIKLISDEYASMVDYAGGIFEFDTLGKICRNGKEIGKLKIKAEIYEE